MMLAPKVGCESMPIHELFIRGDALKLAVEHLGGRNGNQVNQQCCQFINSSLLISIFFS